MTSPKELVDAIIFNTELLKNLKWENTLNNLQNSRNALYASDRIKELATELAQQVENQIATMI
jgi:hypothetical protein